MADTVRKRIVRGVKNNNLKLISSRPKAVIWLF